MLIFNKNVDAMNVYDVIKMGVVKYQIFREDYPESLATNHPYTVWVPKRTNGQQVLPSSKNLGNVVRELKRFDMETTLPI